MQSDTGASFSKAHFKNRQIRADYLKNVNIKIVTPLGHENYVHIGCIEEPPKVIPVVAKSRIVHEPCNGNLFRMDRVPKRGSQGGKHSVHDVEVQTVCTITESKHHLGDRDMGTNGRGCIPIQMRRQFLLATRPPLGTRAGNVSDTALAKDNITKKVMTTAPPQHYFSRECFKGLWQQSNQCFRNADGSCGVSTSHTATNNISLSKCLKHPRTLPPPASDVVAAEVMKQVKYSNPLNAVNRVLPGGNPTSTTEHHIQQTSHPFSSSMENYTRLHTSDSPCQPLEQLPSYLKTDCLANDQQMQIEEFPVQTPQPLKPKLSCVYKDGDVFVIKSRDAVKNEEVCLAPQQAGTALFAIQD